MKLSVVETPQGLEALRDRWDALANATAQGSIFTTLVWQSTWWRHYGKGQRLHVAILEDADELVGVLPMYLQEFRPAPGVLSRVLGYVGTGGDTSPDYLGALIRPGLEATAAAMLARHVVQDIRDWDVIRLTDMQADSSFYVALRDELARAKLEHTAEISARISYLNLPAAWDDYLAAQSRDRRYTVRNTRRKFEALPGARFFLWENGAELDRAIDRLIDLHHLRWQQKGEAHAFSSARYVAFHREVMHATAARNALRLYCMELDGTVIAMYYCYRFRGTVYYVQGGFDPGQERLRPGLCLMGYAIEHAIGEGNDQFDMLRGEYEYKRQWAKELRDTHQLLAYRGNARALAYRLRYSYIPRLKGKIKKTVSSLRGLLPRRATPTAGA